MKKLFVALLTSVFFLLVSAGAAEAAVQCTPRLFKQAVNSTTGQPVSGEYVEVTTSFLSDSGPIYIAYPLDQSEPLTDDNLRSLDVHYCWVASAGATSCGSNSLGTTSVSGGLKQFQNIDNQNYFFKEFTPFTNQENTSWHILPWRNGGFGSYGDQIPGCGEVVIGSTHPAEPLSCNNPGVSYSLTGTNVNIGLSVNGSGMDPTRQYRAMIKREGFDLGGGYSLDINADGNSYTGGGTYGTELPDATYTVVIADRGDNMCNLFTDNFDIRNCAVFPNCISSITIDRTDSTKQVDYDDRVDTIASATANRTPPEDRITSFSLCRQIPILTTDEINAQVSMVQDATKADALRRELTARAQRQQKDKSECCQCTYGTRFWDRNSGACQGEPGTVGEVNSSVVRQRRDFKPGIYTAIGCIGADSESIVTRLVRIGLGIAGGVALLMILAAAFMFSTSQGDPKKAGEAKELITSAVLGLIFIIFSVTLLQFIGVTVLQIPGFGTENSTGSSTSTTP